MREACNLGCVVLAKYEKIGSFEKLYSNDKKDVFEKRLDIECHPKEYDCNYHIEEDECYKINDFSLKEYCPGMLKKAFNSTLYKEDNNLEINKLEYIVVYQNKEYYFQRIFAKNKLKNKKWFEFGENVKLKENENAITLNLLPDALYDTTKDTLFFKKLSAIQKIFPGIEILYREATQAETENFLTENFIKLENGFSADSVKVMNRKRIAIVSDLWSKLDKSKREKILKYTSKYCKNLNFEKGIFSISNEVQLTALLYGLEERYYTTEVGNQKMVANSVKKLSNR